MAVNKMNTELNKIERYLNLNKIKLNVNKTKAMILSTRNNLYNLNLDSINLKFYCERIGVVQEIKYLGVIIDSNMTFKKHVDNILKKILKNSIF